VVVGLSTARRALAAFLAAGALLALAAAPAPGAPADLDRSFGAGGIARIDSAAGPTFPADAYARIAVGPEDEVFVLYSDYEPCDPPFQCAVGLTLLRYDAGGKRDASFGAQIGVSEFTERHAFDLAVGPDGKPVIAAFDQTHHAVTIARFNRDGGVDGGFGVGGKVVDSIETIGDTPIAVAVQPDGKVVVAGEGAYVEDKQQLLLARYQADGSPDPGFGAGGEVAVPLSTQTRPADLLLGPGGTITAAAPLCCAGGSPLYGQGFNLVRLLGDGRVDPGFAGTGQLFFPTPGVEGSVEAAALAPDGSLLVSVEESTETVSTVGNLVKLLPDGSADRAFGGEGRLRIFNRVGSIDPAALAVDGKGRLVGVGWGDGKVAAFRLRPEGSTDRTFNGGQHVNTPFNGIALAVALQASGRIVVLGQSGCCGAKGFALIGLRGGTSRARCLHRKATIVGTQRADKLLGTPRRDVIAALGGKDEVRGLSGADLICGGRGKDKLLGGPGRDQVRP